MDLNAKRAKFVPASRLICIELNPGPGSGVHLDEATRLRIVTLNQDAAMTPTQIARKVQVSRQTISRVLSKYRRTRTVKDQPGRGRKRKLSQRECKEMARKAKKGKAATEIARDYRKKTKKELHEQTVRNVLHEEGLVNLKVQPVEALTNSNKDARLEYSKQMKGYDWTRVLFSDEKLFPLSFVPDRAWQTPGQRVTKQVQRWPKKVNVWGACGHYVKAKLYFFDDTMDAGLYQKIIKSRLKQSALQFSDDCPAEVRQNWVFLQDNARPHTAAKSKEVLQGLVGDRVTTHPPNSPDLNPMEDVWSYLTRRLQTANVKTLEGLKRKIKVEYDSMPWTEFRKSVASMPARLKECVKLQGARTHY